MNKVSKFVIQIVSVSITVLFWVLVLFGIGRTAECAYQFGHRVFAEEPMEGEPGTDKSVTIRRNMSDWEVAKKLEQKNLIDDPALFFVRLQLSAYRGKLQPGTYTLNSSQKAEDMIATMAGFPPEEDGEDKEEAVPSTNKQKTDKKDSKEKGLHKKLK